MGICHPDNFIKRIINNVYVFANNPFYADAFANIINNYPDLWIDDGFI